MGEQRRGVAEIIAAKLREDKVADQVASLVTGAIRRGLVSYGMSVRSGDQVAEGEHVRASCLVCLVRARPGIRTRRVGLGRLREQPERPGRQLERQRTGPAVGRLRPKPLKKSSYAYDGWN
jgi:hypothetical protein